MLWNFLIRWTLLREMLREMNHNIYCLRVETLIFAKQARSTVKKMRNKKIFAKLKRINNAN